MTTAADKKTRTYYRHEIGYSNDPSPHYYAIIAEQEFGQGEEIPRNHFTTKAEAERHGAEVLGRQNRAVGARI